MSNRDNGVLFTLMAAGILAAGVHLSQGAALSGGRNRHDDGDDDDGEDTDDDDTDASGMALSNLKASARHTAQAIAEVESGARVPEWAADRITRAQQHLGDVSGYLVGRRRS
jgi:hypothetical protein